MIEIIFCIVVLRRNYIQEKKNKWEVNFNKSMNNVDSRHLIRVSLTIFYEINVINKFLKCWHKITEYFLQLNNSPCSAEDSALDF